MGASLSSTKHKRIVFAALHATEWPAFRFSRLVSSVDKSMYPSTTHMQHVRHAKKVGEPGKTEGIAQGNIACSVPSLRFCDLRTGRMWSSSGDSHSLALLCMRHSHLCTLKQQRRSKAVYAKIITHCQAPALHRMYLANLLTCPQRGWHNVSACMPALSGNCTIKCD